MIFEYVDQVNQNLICSICCSPFEEPVTLSCHHTFCLGCLHAHFDSCLGDAYCPLCKAAITLAWTQSKIVSLMVDELGVFCGNKDLGCNWTGQRQLLKSHINNCKFVLKRCLNTGCDHEAFDLFAHSQECPSAECSLKPLQKILPPKI